MDRVLKIIYDKRYHRDGNTEILLNGVHPAVISYIEQHNGTNRSVQEICKDIEISNADQQWSCFFRHANFLGYSNRSFNSNEIITIDEIIDDDSIYLLPIEICGNLEDLVQNFKLTINGESYDYSFIDTLDCRIVDYLKTGKVKLLINIIHDPLNNSMVISQIEKYFNNYGIDGSNIIIIGGNNFQEHFQAVPDSKIKITYGYLMVQQAGDRISQFPYIGSLGYKSDAVWESDLDKSKIRTKRFLCWNRTMKHHRYLLAYLALKYDLLNNSYFSFLNPQGGESTIVQYLLSYTNNLEESNYYGKQINELIPYDLDTHNLDAQQKLGFPTNNNKKEFYENSYIHITSETVFNDNSIICPFFSEKTFHPVINLQPFIYVGCVGALKKLKEWGIKTFHPYIDESYDDEYDTVRRFKMIENEIKRLLDKPIEEIHDWYYSIIDILIHNQKTLLSFSSINPFENALKDIQKFYPY
jgi:hypothetical protein